MTTPQNPYAPPGDDRPWQATPQVAPVPDGAPPTAIPKVFGVLSIVFGSMTLLSGLMGGCVGLGFRSLGNMGSALTGSGPAAERARLMMDHMGTIYFYIGIQSFALAIMSAWLLAVGVGQLRYRKWAREQTVYWSIAAFATLVGIVVLSFVFIGPAYQKMFQSIAQAGASGAMPAAFSGSMSKIMGGSMGVTSLVFYSPYPILLLIYFTRPRVVAAMNS